MLFLVKIKVALRRQLKYPLGLNRCASNSTDIEICRRDSATLDRAQAAYESTRNTVQLLLLDEARRALSTRCKRSYANKETPSKLRQRAISPILTIITIDTLFKLTVPRETTERAQHRELF